MKRAALILALTSFVSLIPMNEANAQDRDMADTEDGWKSPDPDIMKIFMHLHCQELQHRLLKHI